MTKPVNHLAVSRFLQLYDDAATQKEIKLSIGFDFHEYTSITRVIPTKQPTTRPFQPPIKSGDGFWMIGVDQNNEVAVLQAVRLYELGRISFAEHLENTFSDEHAIHQRSHESWTCSAPSARKMTGKVAYHGDAWVRRDYRGQGIAKIMGGIAFGVSFAMWAPDYLCGLVEPWLLDKGVVAQYAYEHYEAHGLGLLERNVLYDYSLIWVTGEELRSRVDPCEKSIASADEF